VVPAAARTAGGALIESWQAIAFVADWLSAPSALVAALDAENTGAVKICDDEAGADSTWATPWIMLSIWRSPGPIRVPGGSKVWSPGWVQVDLSTHRWGKMSAAGV
jgi:hypothetical protein